MDNARSSVQISNIDYILQRPEVRSLPSAQIDDLVNATAYTYYEPSTAWPEVLALSTADAHLWLSLAAIAHTVVAVPELKRLVAVFDHRPGYAPLRRAYFYCCDESGAAPFEAMAGMSRARQCSMKLLPFLLRQPQHEDDVRKWAAGYREQMAAIDKVAEGRRENTAVDAVYVLSSPDGRCLICEDTPFGFAATTIGSAETAAMVTVQLCERHHAAAREHASVLQFIFTFLGVDLPFHIEVRNHALNGPIIEIMMDIVRAKTGARVGNLEYDPDKQQYNVKINFPSGFYLHLRLKSLDDYGYMLFDPNKRQLKRIDTAGHHSSRLVYGPTHLHLEPDVCNANVTDSFTYGIPLFDLKLMLRLVEEAERAWNSES